MLWKLFPRYPRLKNIPKKNDKNSLPFFLVSNSISFYCGPSVNRTRLMGNMVGMVLQEVSKYHLDCLDEG